MAENAGSGSLPIITYSIEDLLYLRDSPLIKKPDGLPSFENWLNQPATRPAPSITSTQTTPFRPSYTGAIKPPFNSKGSSDAFVLTEGIPAAKSRPQIPSAAATTRTWRSEAQPDNATSAFKEKPKGGTSRLDGLSQALLNARAANPKSRFANLVKDQPSSQKQSQPVREPTPRQPEWIADEGLESASSSSKPMHTQEDFERWKERMRAGNRKLEEEEEEDEEEEEEDDPIVHESDSEAFSTRPIPVNEHAFKDLLIPSTSAAEASEPAKVKPSRFASFFSGASSAAKTDEQPIPSETSSTGPSGANTADGEAEAFDRVMSMLSKSRRHGTSSATNTPVEPVPASGLPLNSGQGPSPGSMTNSLYSDPSATQSRYFPAKDPSRTHSEGLPEPVINNTRQVPLASPPSSQPSAPQDSTRFLLSLMRDVGASHAVPIQHSHSIPGVDYHGAPSHHGKHTPSPQHPAHLENRPGTKNLIFSPGLDQSSRHPGPPPGLYDQPNLGVPRYPPMNSQPMDSHMPVGPASQFAPEGVWNPNMPPNMGVNVHHMPPPGHPENMIPPPGFPPMVGDGMVPPPEYGPPGMMYMGGGPPMGPGGPPPGMDPSRMMMPGMFGPGGPNGPPMPPTDPRMGPIGYYPSGMGPSPPPGFPPGAMAFNVPPEFYGDRGNNGMMPGHQGHMVNNQMPNGYPPPDMIGRVTNGRYM